MYRILLDQVGSIPYGEVFGELHGVASIAEFLAYMDHYSRDTSLSYLHGGMGEGDFSEFKAPLYVFDSEVLKRNFAGFYSLPGWSVSACVCVRACIESPHLCACVRVCVRACVPASMRTCMCARVCVYVYQNPEMANFHTEIFSLWTTANVTQYHQMILGPAGMYQ